MNLEQHLRQALERKDPAAGFDRRVMARVATGEAGQAGSRARRNGVVFLPIAASAHTDQAVHDVVLALRIASEKFSEAQAKVEEMTRYEPAKNN